MEPNGIFRSVKTALRWKHNALDGEIRENIRAAQDELIRVGVSETAARSDHPLIVRAVKTYCKACFADDQGARDGFMQAFHVQADGLRKTGTFNSGGA